MNKFFYVPFANSGDKAAVPVAVDVSGNVSYTQGYGFDYQRPKTDPTAKNIERNKANQLYYDITKAISELQSQGVPDFIDSSLNGGAAFSYSINAMVRYADDIYLSLTNANTADPTDVTKWALLPKLNVSNIWTAGQVTAIAGSAGMRMRNTTAAPAANTLLGDYIFEGKNVAGTIIPYAMLTGEVLDSTTGSEDGGLILRAYRAGAFYNLFKIRQGIFAEGLLDMGVGTGNFTEVYKNGVAVGGVSLSDFTGGNQSLATSGYQKLPGGLIIQWGTSANSAGTTPVQVIFPVAFPTACVSVSRMGIKTAAYGGGEGNEYTYSKSLTDFYFCSGYGTHCPQLWFAIGY